MNNIKITVKEFLKEYLYLECETHLTKADRLLYDSDLDVIESDNTEKEYNLFTELRIYITDEYRLTSDELVSDIYNDNGIVKINIHDMATDHKRKLTLNI